MRPLANGKFPPSGAWYGPPGLHTSRAHRPEKTCAMIRILAMVAALCGAGVAPAWAGAQVETGEGLAYDLPEGWRVLRYSAMDGSATLIDGVGRVIHVIRYGKPKDEPYANNLGLADGRVLEWYEYEDGAPHFRDFFVLHGRVTLPQISVQMVGRNCHGGFGCPGPVARAPLLAAMRQIGESVVVLGSRRCMDEDACEGVVRPKE